MIGRLRALPAVIALPFALTLAGCGWGGSPPSAAPAPNVAALPSLIRSLQDRRPESRTRAAVAIGRMGSAASEAIPALTAALKDRDLTVRASAAHALGKIGPDARSALPLLQDLTKQAPLREIVRVAIHEIEN